MATRIADVVVPAVFNPYVIQRTAELSALRRSGIVSSSIELNRLATAGGKLINMPYWEDLSGDDEVLSDNGALTPGKIEADQDIAVLLMRGKAWATNDLAKALAGSDPMGAIGDLVAEYWARREQATLIATLNGVFAAASMAASVHNISIADGNASTAANRIGAEAVINAATKLGDAAGGLTAISMHSVPYSNLQKDDLIDFQPTSGQNVGFGTYLGKTVIVDDSHPRVAGATSGFVYTSFLFGAGAIGLGEGAAPVPTETDRDSLRGDDLLVNRRHYLLHPRGVKFTSSSVATSSPTNAELAIAANWVRVYEQKNVRLVALRTNG